MDSYEVQWKKSAEKDIRAIDIQQILRIIKAVESLSTNPLSRTES
jgi:thymidylate synthase